MENVKKLRLKRKIPHQKALPTAKKSQVQVAVQAKTVILSSDSDDGENSLQSKQRKHSDQSQIGFLQTNSPSLNKLREMILSMTQKEILKTSWTPFPAFPSEDKSTEVRTSTEKADKLCHRSILSVGNIEHVKDLPPFPKLCKHFLQGRTNKVEICSKHNSDLKTSKADVQHEKCNINDGIPSLQKKGASQTNQLDEDNSAFIRDRNSNFYALQTKNISLKSSENSNLKHSKDTSCITYRNQSDSHANLQCEVNDRKIFSNSHNASQNVLNMNSEGASLMPNSTLCDMKEDDHKGVGTQSNSTSHHIKVENKKDETLQRCPLCQTLFDSSSDQMEIDSHIASCLATSEDDVMW